MFDEESDIIIPSFRRESKTPLTLKKKVIKTGESNNTEYQVFSNHFRLSTLTKTTVFYQYAVKLLDNTIHSQT